jgi:hypothetical protein
MWGTRQSQWRSRHDSPVARLEFAMACAGYDTLILARGSGGRALAGPESPAPQRPTRACWRSLADMASEEVFIWCIEHRERCCGDEGLISLDERQSRSQRPVLLCLEDLSSRLLVAHRDARRQRPDMQEARRRMLFLEIHRINP